MDRLWNGNGVLTLDTAWWYSIEFAFVLQVSTHLRC